MRPSWKLIGLAGLAGVAATGVVVARKRRAHRHYDPDELRERLHRRLAEATAGSVVSSAMSADDPLERLSSEELYQLAVRHARRHLDVGFFWRLLELLPAAEAAAGELNEAEADVTRLSAHLDDLTDAGRGDIADALRPFYLEYLHEHGVTPADT
jgi:hypothetical protein